MCAEFSRRSREESEWHEAGCWVAEDLLLEALKDLSSVTYPTNIRLCIILTFCAHVHVYFMLEKVKDLLKSLNIWSLAAHICTFWVTH